VRRRFKPDKWNKSLGSRIPAGAMVEIVKFMPRRRVLIKYRGELILTMLWCVPKARIGINTNGRLNNAKH